MKIKRSLLIASWLYLYVFQTLTTTFHFLSLDILVKKRGKLYLWCGKRKLTQLNIFFFLNISKIIFNFLTTILLTTKSYYLINQENSVRMYKNVLLHKKVVNSNAYIKNNYFKIDICNYIFLKRDYFLFWSLTWLLKPVYS